MCHLQHMECGGGLIPNYNRHKMHKSLRSHIALCREQSMLLAFCHSTISHTATSSAQGIGRGGLLFNIVGACILFDLCCLPWSLVRSAWLDLSRMHDWLNL